MEIDSKFLELIRGEIKDGMATFRTEMKAGFAELSAGLSQTNAQIDQNNTRIDQNNERLGQAIVRSDQTNVRLDAAITMMRDFRKDVSSRFDEVGVYLRSINGSLLGHEERIKSLEHRVDRLEHTS